MPSHVPARTTPPVLPIVNNLDYEFSTTRHNLEGKGRTSGNTMALPELPVRQKAAASLDFENVRSPFALCRDSNT